MKWKTFEENVYKNEDRPDVVSGSKTVHFLNLAEGNKFCFLNIQITETESMDDTPNWDIIMTGTYCELFVGSLAEAKEKALIHLPKAIVEFEKVINNYNLVKNGKID